MTSQPLLHDILIDKVIYVAYLEAHSKEKKMRIQDLRRKLIKQFNEIGIEEKESNEFLAPIFYLISQTRATKADVILETKNLYQKLQRNLIILGLFLTCVMVGATLYLK